MELTFTLNVSFELGFMFGVTDTDSLRLDISVVLGSESSLGDAYNSPRCENASPVCHGLLLGEVTTLIFSQIDCSKSEC